MGSFLSSTKGMCELWWCLEDGACPALQELDMTEVSCRGAVAARCLHRGLTGCPDLRRLGLCVRDDETTRALAVALEQGLCPKLEALSVMGHSLVDPEAGEALAAALRAFHRPTVRELELMHLCFVNGLADTLSSGACGALTRLVLVVGFTQDTSRVALIEALGGGLQLKELDLNVLEGDKSLGSALAQAAYAGTLPVFDRMRICGVRVRHIDDVTVLTESDTRLIMPKPEGGSLEFVSNVRPPLQDFVMRRLCGPTSRREFLLY
jgi:hypothetical protein